MENDLSILLEFSDERLIEIIVENEKYPDGHSDLAKSILKKRDYSEIEISELIKEYIYKNEPLSKKEMFTYSLLFWTIVPLFQMEKLKKDSKTRKHKEAILSLKLGVLLSILIYSVWHLKVAHIFF